MEWESFVDYLLLGIEHIWTGYDHLLFLIAIMLGSAAGWDYVKLLTSFTIGHSLTLALASLDLVSVPPSIIEPLIALSIVIAVADALIRTRQKSRWQITLLFGLVHGFGFAGILQGFDSAHFILALFSFNLGVEIGQLTIVAIVLPLLYYFRKRTGRAVHYSLSAVIGCLGCYWFVERMLSWGGLP